MRGVAIAAALGAGISSFLYLTVKFGVDAGFRAAAYVNRRRETQREKRSAAA